MSSVQFRELMDRFYAIGTSVLVEHEAIVDKFVGDEVIGIFVPVMTDGLHARVALEAGVQLLRATGHAGGNPWVAVGIGINTGIAYVGAVGTDEHVEFTALGDIVNVTARLSTAAAAGELLATADALHAADVAPRGLERRHVTLKGKSEMTEVFVLSASGTSGEPA